MISDTALNQLERDVTTALSSGDASGLRLLGEGEISLVLAAGTSAEGTPTWACKRLPPFATRSAAEQYSAVVERYIGELSRRGISVVDTDLRQITRADGTAVLYCVQAALPESTLAVGIAHDDDDGGRALVAQIVEVIPSVVDATVGLDAQLSNWAALDDRLTYIDVTTPLLRDADGNPELDTEVFVASLPWALRPPVRRFVLPGIIERYHDPRTVTLDLASNLIKEDLSDLVEVVLDACAGLIEPPLTEGEVRKDRTSDARTWAALQSVRRIDRGWQSHVRRRPYPFLLPTYSSH